MKSEKMSSVRLQDTIADIDCKVKGVIALLADMEMVSFTGYWEHDYSAYKFDIVNSALYEALKQLEEISNSDLDCS